MLREKLGRIPIFIAISTICAILLSSSFVLQINQGAWAGTFPGPNGLIAFVTNRDDNPESGNLEIYVMNADGSGQTRLTDNTVNDEGPSWSPDGEKIAFSRVSGEGGSGFAEIYVMNADGSGQTRLTESVQNDPSLFHPGDIDPSWSPDGEKIAFSSFRHADVNTAASNGEIYVMNADGSEETRLTNNEVYDSDPSWSPDGEKIAFTSSRDDPGGNNAEIYVMNAADGSDVTRLTNNDAFDADPSWSPDGTKIAFSSTRDGNFETYVMNADGSDPTRLTTTENELEEHPSWSPDGTKIAFIRSGTTVNDLPEIYVMNAADGSEETRLTNNEAHDFVPDWGTNTSPPGSGGNGDTTSPVITVPQNITEEATSTEGAQVTYTVTAEDNIDGTATLEEDGSLTQDDVGGNITILCEPPSGSEFPVGDTEVQCTATDEADNVGGPESFTVTVNPPPPPPPPPSTLSELIDELISTIENLDDDNVPQSLKTSLIAVLNQVLNILNDNIPNNDESVCGTLDALINQVNANERSDTLTADEADEISTQSEEIRNALDC